MKTLTISDETFELIKNQLKEEEKFDLSGLSDLVDKVFFFRTVTYHLIGRVKKVFGTFAVLEDAAWIPDSGRFMQAIKAGTLNEVEPVGNAIINLSTITDMFPWKHPIPSEQK